MGVTVDFHDDGCALVTMRNGENRLNSTFLKQLNDALDLVERNASCKILITTGEGKFYSNGVDLDWVMSQGGDNQSFGMEFSKQVVNTMRRLLSFPLPTVAAVNGHAFAGGACVVKGHDYCVMNSERGWISWNEALINRRFSKEMADILRMKMNSEVIREAIVFAKRFTGPEAAKLGIVDIATTPENLISESKRLGFGALGQNQINRSHLQDMKRDLMQPKL